MQLTSANQGHTALIEACRYGCTNTIKVQSKLTTPFVELEFPQTTLHSNRNTILIQTLHELGADANKAISRGVTPCWAAARFGCNEVIKTLHQLGADLNLADHKGDTPVIVAAISGHVESVRILHGFGADIEKPNKSVSRVPV